VKLSIRLILFLVVGITLVTFVIARNQVRSEKRGLRADLERRAEIFGESLQEIVEPAIEKKGSGEQLRHIVERFGNRERLAGVAVYSPKGAVLAESSTLIIRYPPPPVPLQRIETTGQAVSEFLRLNDEPMHAYYLPLRAQDSAKIDGILAIFHDAGYIETQSERIWRDTLWHVIAQVLLITFVTFLIIRWTIVLPLSRTAKWMKDLRSGRAAPRPPLPQDEFFGPLSKEVVNLTRSLAEARATAEEEARLRETGISMWTAERLRISVRKNLLGPLFVVSNREPYMHVRHGKSIETVIPASGLVTALEPILRACDGTWIAFGSGDADKATVDRRDHIRVPDRREYTLRRVWLSKETEQGYYYGFSNEGLWPLCHIAHTRPVFRASDWQAYQDANRKFADAVLEELDGVEHALLLIQDYHFALLPRMVKQARPDVRVAIFWHIPWPNPEAFGICPWQRELLDGLLGSDLVGFHTQAHCNNFLETVDAALESRIEWEHFAVNRTGHTTSVRPFPISVDFREAQTTATAISACPYELRSNLLKKLGVQARFLGIGVDRIDYTKGILERFQGIERFLEKYPSYRRKFTFVQIGAPSRNQILRYQNFMEEVQAEANRINTRFSAPDWKPIALLLRHHHHDEIMPYYRAADFCMVTSLHDGMNLVAKEFVAAREDEEGALILSQFTGASRELRDALVVNPYDADELAEAIRMALEMDASERHLRMQRMRRLVREHNVYRWAANLISELSEMRIEEAESAVANPETSSRHTFAANS
jgi:alpha,alpha-trehalose-phosphate synthase [UDP-forming]